MACNVDAKGCRRERVFLRPPLFYIFGQFAGCGRSGHRSPLCWTNSISSAYPFMFSLERGQYSVFLEDGGNSNSNIHLRSTTSCVNLIFIVLLPGYGGLSSDGGSTAFDMSEGEETEQTLLDTTTDCDRKVIMMMTRSYTFLRIIFI